MSANSPTPSLIPSWGRPPACRLRCLWLRRELETSCAGRSEFPPPYSLKMRIADLLWRKIVRGGGDPSNRQAGGLPHRVTFLSRIIITAVSLILIAPELWAAQAEATGIVPSSSSVLVTIFRMTGALAIVFAVFFCGVWLFRNWQGLLRQRGVAPKLRVMEFKSLGTRQALYVVAYERQRFLISSSSAGVALLTPLPEADEEPVSAVTHAPTFADALLKVLNKK